MGGEPVSSFPSCVLEQRTLVDEVSSLKMSVCHNYSFPGWLWHTEAPLPKCSRDSRASGIVTNRFTWEWLVPCSHSLSRGIIFVEYDLCSIWEAHLGQPRPYSMEFEQLWGFMYLLWRISPSASFTLGLDRTCWALDNSTNYILHAVILKKPYISSMSTPPGSLSSITV